MAAEKRPASNSFGESQIVKRQRSDVDFGTTNAVALGNGTPQNGTLTQTGPRSTGLHSSVMELAGHSGEVFATRFDPTGRHIASGSMDRSIMLWRAHGQCENYGQLIGHKGAVLDLHWSRDTRLLLSASADATVASWDTETGQRIRRHEGHDGVINSMDVSKRGMEMFISGGDDGTIGVWDPRQKEAVNYMETEYPVTAVVLPEAGNEIYSGGVDNAINVWDIRKQEVAYAMKGHNDTICSLQVSPDGQTLLSNSHDSTVRTWDIRPFAPMNRHVKTYDGAPAGMEKNLLKASWDVEGNRIVAGSGDRSVVIWETRTAKIMHKLPGHKGAVNDCRLSPVGAPLIVSGSTDRKVILGELSK